MKKKSVLRKVLAVSLSAAMLLGTGFTTAGQFVGTSGISVGAADEDYFVYSTSNDGTLGVYGMKSNYHKINIVIPSSINGKSVTSIYYNNVTYSNEVRFQGNTNIISVTIPDTVQTIDKSSFHNCASMMKLNLGNGVATIGKNAFENCNSLGTVTLPDSLTKLDERAFYNCNSLETVNIGSGLDDFNLYAFQHCRLLKNINVSEENTEYSSIDGVLFDKDKMTLMYYPIGRTDKEYVIPDDTVFVYTEAFWIGGENRGENTDCLANLESVICPNTLQTIGKAAFYQLTSLKTIRLGKNIKTIQTNAFYGCSALTDIYYEGSETDWKNIRIDSGNESLTNATIHFNYKEAEPLENNSELSQTSIDLGETVDITADAKGGTENYEYEIVYKTTDALGWETLQDYSANSSINFKPVKVGRYDIRVNVRDDNGTIATKDFSLEVNMTALENLSSLSAENITLGDTVNINAAAKGGTGEYKYQIVYKKNSAEKWSTIQAYNVNSAVTFKLSSAGTYDVCVKVKDTSNTEVKKFFTLYVADNKLKNYSTISASSIELGESVIVNAKATGSTGFYQYAFYYKKAADTKWTTKQGFKANSIVTIKPSKATTYDICVKIKDNKGTVVKKYFTLEVTEKANKLSNISALSDTEIALGEKITVSASANGSTGFYQYAVSYKNTNDTDWTTVQDYSANSIVSVKPTIVGSYSICVSVKDDFNNKADKYFIVTVN